MTNDRKDELEACVAIVLQAGLSTGHADTVVELFEEVITQVDALRAQHAECNQQLIAYRQQVYDLK